MALANKTIGTDFTKGNIAKHLLTFLVPFLLANVLNSIYNTVDMIIIGKYAGSVGTVAVSQGGKLLNMFTHMSMSLAGAGQIMIGQQLGANQKNQVKSTIGTLFSLLFMIAIATSIICLILSHQILVWLQTPEESFSSALAYLRITAVGFVLTYGYNAVSSVLRGMGESKMPLLFIAIAACVNLILDIILIGVFNLGAAGTAIATVTGQGVSLVFSVAFLYKRKERFGFDFKLKSFIIVKDKMKTLLKIGVPMAASGFCIMFTQLVMISFVNGFGLIQAAAYSIGDKIIQLTNVVSQSVRQAGGSVVAQNLGAKEHVRVKKSVRASLMITVGFASVMAVISFLFPDALFKLFSSDADVLHYSKQIMAIAAVTYVLAALSSSFDTVTAGSGFAKLSFMAGFIDGVVLRVSLGLLFGLYFKMEAVGFFLGHGLARISPVCMHGAYFISGAWKKRKLLVDVKDTLEIDDLEEALELE